MMMKKKNKNKMKKKINKYSRILNKVIEINNNNNNYKLIVILTKKAMIWMNSN